jgi:RNA polymerase sigma-70 factor (sigma-E family)
MVTNEVEDFVEYVEARGPRLYRLACLLMAGNRALAEDVLQTTLEKGFLSWGKLRDPNAADAYMRTILARTAARSRASRSAAPFPGDMEVRTGSGSPETETLARLELWPYICRLPARQRSVIVLRYYEDLSEAEIARVLGCSQGAVKSHSSRALASLRRHLKPASPTEVNDRRRSNEHRGP